MSVEELKKYIFKSKYARHNCRQSRRETFPEANNRVRQMMLEKYPQASEQINWAYDQLLQERVLGSQRALQYGGNPVFQHNARLYNCTCSYADRLRFFQEAMYLLLCGCGVGFSVQRHHVSQLPFFYGRGPLRYNFPIDGNCTESLTLGGCKIWRDPAEFQATFVIPDTIEGWSDAVGVLMSSYFPDGPFPEYVGKQVTFDYSLIRPEGSYLSSGAGRAPGPEPLRVALEKIRSLLDRCLRDGQDRLRPIDVYDIVMHASNAVLAGGVRRSATICVFSPDDTEMLMAKSMESNWWIDNPQRARSNNSALLVRGKTTREEFNRIMQPVKAWGEPGFVWADHEDFLVNPCVEIGMWPRLRLHPDSPILQGYKGPIGTDGAAEFYNPGGPPSVVASGWQFCNLTTINGGKIETPEDFYQACRAASIIGTLQAGFSDFPYLGRVTEEIVRNEALLGVSITAVMESPNILLDPEVLREGARIVLETNREMAHLIGINPCARGTCMKPEGTGTLMLGSMACGAHAHPFPKRGIKRVQANHNEVVFNWFRDFNPDACEKSVWDEQGRTWAIKFPIETPPGVITKQEMGAVDFLGKVKLIYENWVVPGKRPDRCSQNWLHHSVSNTVSVRPDEWDDVENFIYDNRHSFAGISLLSYSGDKDYPQAPNVAVYTPEEMRFEYGDVLDHRELLELHIRWGLDCFNGNLWKACDAIPEGQGEWESVSRGLAKEYLGGDIQKFTYLLKDFYNWNQYVDLKTKMVPVDYEALYEEEDMTQPQQESACSGGACSL